jgi:signal transduction histidine kinase
MKYISKKFILYFFFIILFSNGYSQALDRNQSIVAYIYNFAKQISWQNESEYENFNIVLYTDDVNLKNSLEKNFANVKINNKTVNIFVLKEFESIPQISRFVYISENKLSAYYSIYEQIRNKPIVIISENFSDKKNAMLNLYDSKNRKMLFEINKSNILNQGLKVSEEITLMGGTIIDVTDLYKNSQTNLKDIEKKLSINELKLDSVNKLSAKIKIDIAKQEKLIDDLKLLIDSKKRIIETQKSELDEQIKKSNDQNYLIEKQSFVLYEQRDSLKTQIRKLKNSEKSLKNQAIELIKGNVDLMKQQEEISKMDLILVEKTNELGKQSITISKQRQILWLFSFVIVLIVFIIIFIFIALRNNRRKNILLNNHRVKIEEINNELQASIEEIQATNEELHNKNEELETTLGKLKEAQESLLQAEKMASIGVLTAGIAHEMNNPINFVYAGVNSLKKDFVDLIPILDEIDKLKSTDSNLPEKIKYIEELKQENQYSDALDAIKQTIDDIKLGADRTTEIVKGLKNFSRIDKEEWNKQNIHECINDALVILRNKYKMNIEIIKNFDEEIPQIDCYPGKLNQVFVNIISNSIDAIEDKGEIKITTIANNEYLTVKIKDSGQGINPEVKAKIFDPFFTTKKVGKGQGLGLSITYGIIKEHKGNIEVITEKNKGTEFIIQLPIKQTK